MNLAASSTLSSILVENGDACNLVENEDTCTHTQTHTPSYNQCRIA